MSRDKAREFFSAYLDNTLEPGLRSTFEAKLAQDSDLKADLADFQSTFAQLESLSSARIAIPGDLHERISQKLDRHVWSQKQASKPSWLLGLRNFGLAAGAALIVFGGIYSLRSGGSVSGASMFPAGTTVEKISATGQNGAVNLKFAATNDHVITVKVGASTKESEVSKGTNWSSELRNPQPSASSFLVSIQGESRPYLVIVPGASPQSRINGEGTIEELGKAIADTYRLPVIIEGGTSTNKRSWKLQQTDATVAAQGALSSQEFSVEMRSGNVLWIVAQ